MPLSGGGRNKNGKFIANATLVCLETSQITEIVVECMVNQQQDEILASRAHGQACTASSFRACGGFVL